MSFSHVLFKMISVFSLSLLQTVALSKTIVIPRVPTDHLDSSLEVEVPFTQKTRKFVTASEDASREFAESFLKTKLWKSQKKLISDEVENGSYDFDLDRSIPFLKMNPLISIKCPKPTFLFGKLMPAGSHTIDITSVLIDPRVEFAGHQDTFAFERMELHFRSNLSAGSLHRSVRNLFLCMTIPTRVHHLHILKDVSDLSALSQSSKSPYHANLKVALKETYAFQLVNILASMIAIVEDKRRLEIRIERFESPKGEVFEVEKSNQFLNHMFFDLFEYTFKFTKGKKAFIADALKMGRVGYRGSNFYVGGPFFGYEYRQLPGKGSVGLQEKVLNAIQKGMSTKSMDRIFQAQFEEMTMNLEEKIKVKGLSEIFDQQLASLWPLTLLEKDLHRYHIDANLRPALIFQKSKKDMAILFLTYKWCLHKLFQDFSIRKLWKNSQLEKLVQLLNVGDEATNEIVADFLLQSGLYCRMLQVYDIPKSTSRRSQDLVCHPRSIDQT